MSQPLRFILVAGTTFFKRRQSGDISWYPCWNPKQSFLRSCRKPVNPKMLFMNDKVTSFLKTQSR